MDWGNPEQRLQSRQFIEVLETCTERRRPPWAGYF
jgi:RNA polymerase sigma-70 factor (ECF subfamily)